MAIFGNPTGPTYSLGRINVAVAGTPANLNQNSSSNNSFGTITTPATIRCNQIIFKAPGGGAAALAANVGNTGTVYICHKGGNRTIQNSIIWDLAPGGSFVLGVADASPLYDPTQYVIDADNNGDGCRVTLVMGH